MICISFLISFYCFFNFLIFSFLYSDMIVVIGNNNNYLFKTFKKIIEYYLAKTCIKNFFFQICMDWCSFPWCCFHYRLTLCLLSVYNLSIIYLLMYLSIYLLVIWLCHSLHGQQLSVLCSSTNLTHSTIPHYSIRLKCHNV